MFLKICLLLICVEMVFRRSAFTRFPVRRRARANPKDGTLRSLLTRRNRIWLGRLRNFPVPFGQLLRNGKFLSIRMVLPM